MKKYILGFITGLLVAAASVAFARSSYFVDVVASQWYAGAVTSLSDAGIVSGYPDGTFHPEKPVTRAEVAQMLFKMKQYVDMRADGKTASQNITPAAPAVASVGANSQSCAVISNPANTREVVVSNVDELKAAVASANETGNVVIALRDGTYTISKDLWVTGNNIMFKSQSGNRDAVTVRGLGMSGTVASVFHFQGDNNAAVNLTVGYVANHPIQVHGELDADNVLIHNVRFVDGHEQLLKASYNAGNLNVGSDNGVVECSLFEYSAGVGPQYYIGGIDVHNGKNWIVRNNVFKNIRSPETELAEHAIHFWSGSQGTLVENNTIINSDRGVGFGLGDRGHVGGIIRNNFIYHDANSRGDAGITLETAPGVQVYGNKIYFENDYPNAIEYRFSSTAGVSIHDNITNRAIKERDGASATLLNNSTNALRDLFQVELGKF